MQHDFMLTQGSSLNIVFSILDAALCAARFGLLIIWMMAISTVRYFCRFAQEALIECGRLKLKNTPILQLMDSFDLTSLFAIS